MSLKKPLLIACFIAVIEIVGFVLAIRYLPA
jgi:hypothetical protein